MLQGMVIPSAEVLDQLRSWMVDAQGEDDQIAELVIGDGTSSTIWQHQLPASLKVRVVDETGTTLRARARYWQLWPARGWKRLLPLGLRIPSGDLDAIAALVILEHYLGRSLQWPGPDPLKNAPSR
ncbi:polynucleotidyl transferase/ ribonuclease H fold superfamily [Synechococcus sp. MVIR-18-1]|nr:polynucleotidyl transferase/ ribonuclease H fold superfamily [Synechococcus sp. MVIR-18-1]